MSDTRVRRGLLGAREKYEFVKRLLEESKNDPPNEPFKSKYRAKEIIQKIETELFQLEPTEDEDIFQVSTVSALLNYEMGVISVETEEPSEGEKYLQKAWETIEKHSLKPDCVILAVSILNELGILWAGRNEVGKARDYLCQAECIYGEYKLSKNPCPVEFEDMFLSKDLRKMKDDWSVLEKALTLTLYYLAQVYGHLGDNEASGKYCHMTLKRQLESKDYEPLEWAINCAMLSQYFITKEKFAAARHVLACANQMIDEYEETVKKEVENKDDEKWEQLNRGKADVARCWAKYVLRLLISSQDKALESDSELNSDMTGSDSSEDSIKFYQLMKESKVKEYENKITCNFATDYEQARAIFLFGQEQLKLAKVFYVLDEHTYDYVQIIQDHSKLYKYLVFFEKDNDRKCKMHKRRIDMLEEVLKELNMQFYLALCRQLMFELAEIYSEMMDLKYLIHGNDKQAIGPHAVKKINFLTSKSIGHYKAFIDTLKDSTKKLPATFSEDVARPALVAHFCLGRLYSKLIGDRMREAANLQKGEEYYQFVIDYVDKNPDHEKFIRNELPVIKEMVELIPGKMHKILGDTMF